MSNKAKSRHDLNRSLPIGSKCKCPTCGTSFIKKSYQHTFCSNKTNNRSSCKDVYHNTTNPDRYERAYNWRQALC